MIERNFSSHAYRKLFYRPYLYTENVMSLLKAKQTVLFLLTFALLQWPTVSKGNPSLIGAWRSEGSQETSHLIFQSNDTLIFNGEKANYTLSSGVIRVQDEWIVDYPYTFIGEKLVITFPEGYQMQFARVSGTNAPGQQSGLQNTSPAAPGVVNPSELARQIAGKWWGYSGSTEKQIGLCPNGNYRDYSESSFSGNSFDSSGNLTYGWGTANQNSGSGTWSIQGDFQQGVIYVHYDNGNQVSIRYQQTGESGCLFFNGSKLCRNGYCD